MARYTPGYEVLNIPAEQVISPSEWRWEEGEPTLDALIEGEVVRIVGKPDQAEVSDG